uniref:N/A n=1 Tax=Ganoderma boninense TaxID=34458 RepID=A0A5K1JSK2_9APHY|nr:N/A [Ganoderma boninense]
MTANPAYPHHKLLIANRGEIAVRILRTAKRLGIHTIAVYTRSDATAPHVVLADEVAPLRPDDADPVSNARGYLDGAAIVAICRERGATLLHPGYGFLSEDARFAREVRGAGVAWLGPQPETIEAMGLKHSARDLAREVDVPLVPGSRGLLQDVDGAVACAEEMGFPVMLKSTAGGGGMGLVVCGTAAELRARFPSIKARAQTLFKNDGLFIERYYPAARHVEVQVFGDGAGHAIHMGERECSIQRRHQKVIEEAPSPFMLRHPNVREKMCDAAVRLAKHVKYESAGTVEFLVDDATGGFFFLEMNTRLQASPPLSISPSNGYFKPCPGVLQQVNFPDAEWLRVDSWVETGTTITPYFDPLACKLIVTGSTRAEAIERLQEALDRTEMYGPPNNVQYLRAVCASERFLSGEATTSFLSAFTFVPSAFTVLSASLETTVQDYPGRRIGLGIPRSGPMDSLAFRIANILAGNDPGTEGLELTLTGCRLLFHTTAVVAVTGAPAKVTVDGKEVRMWERLIVPAGAKFAVGTAQQNGMRSYLAIRGGFPEIPKYLRSKSTSMGMGGYQGRALTAGDHIALGECAPTAADSSPPAIPESLIPAYPHEWTIHVLPGPQCDPTFITEEGITDFFATRWTVSAASNRMGVRLEGPRIAWARENGGEGGSHPSNILDNGYAFGTINVNGDTPVILTNEGPDMGGYVCICTVASAELCAIDGR